MLVSVIVPVYKVEKYLATCIESICNQTYKKLEIILVDDGSPDNCGAICDEYAKKDARIRVIHKENEGQAVARNYALDICKGDYIMFVDSDDMIKSDMAEKLLQAVVYHQCDIGACGIIFKKKHSEEVFEYDDTCILKSPQLLQWFFQGKTTSVMCDKIYTSKLFENVRFPVLRSREDAYVLPEILGSCKSCVVIPEKLYIQNIREDSTEQKPVSQEKIDAAVAALKHQQEYLRKFYPQLCREVVLSPAVLHLNFLKELIAKNGCTPRHSLYRQQLEALLAELEQVDCNQLSEEQTRLFYRLYQIKKYPILFYWYRKMVCLLRKIQGKLHLR